MGEPYNKSWPTRHGELWYNTDDKKYRAYDEKILKWCTYDETEDQTLKQILRNIRNIERITTKCPTRFLTK